MLKYLILALFLPGVLMAQTTTLETITHDGLERDYVLYLPPSYEEGSEMPLVFNFHGLGSNANEQFAYTLLHTVAAEEGFILVYPNGTENSVGVPFWNAGFGVGETVDDVGFTIAILDELVAELSVDESRVYSTGMSNGGYFSYKLACEHSNRFAAVASVTGSMVVSEFENCSPERPVPIMQFHGTEDPTVNFDGDEFSVSIEDVVDLWIDINDCDPMPLFTEVPDIDNEDQSTAEHFVYVNSETLNAVEFYKINGGGHTWPGADFIIGVTNQDIDASTLIWEFFSKHSIEESFPSGIEDESLINRVYPNPIGNSFRIELESETEELNVYNAQGLKVEVLAIEGGQSTNIDSSTWLKGIYFVSQLNSRGELIRVDRLLK